MQPLLTIAIPTYNRPQKLRELFDSFLEEIVETNLCKIEVLIFDNSDEKIADKNRILFEHDNILYEKNSENLEYQGNLVKCLSHAKGSFIWVVSDDDEICTDILPQLLKTLLALKNTKVNCIMLSVLNSDGLGITKVTNTSYYWKCKNGDNINSLLSKNNILPFILFSSAIIRNHQNIKDISFDTSIHFEDNDFIQIPLYLSIIGKGSLHFFEDVVLKYNATGDIRFNIENMFNSMLFVINFYSGLGLITTNTYKKKNYKMWAGWFLMGKSKLYKVPGISGFRCKLMPYLVESLSTLNFGLTLLFFIPGSILRNCYLIRSKVKKWF